MYHFLVNLCQIQTKMKLFTTLVVIALAASATSADYSDFTTSIMNYVFMEKNGILRGLDTLYPQILQSGPNPFDSLIMSPENTAPEVVKYITVNRQNYKPWYTDIQTNIDNGKAKAVTAITTAMDTFASVADKIEAKYNTTVQKFAARGCSSFPVYSDSAKTKLTSIMSTISSVITSFQTNAYGAIPSGMISTLSNAISTAMSNSIAGVSTITLVKQAENATMQPISDLYTKAVKYTTVYARELFSNAINTNMARIDSILNQMAKGAETAPCN